MNPYKLVLNEIEQDCLERLAKDIVTIGALKKVLLFGVYFNGTLKKGENPNPLLNFAARIGENDVNMSNETMGSILRAKVEGLATVEMGFRELEKFKKEEKPKGEESNPAR